MWEGLKENFPLAARAPVVRQPTHSRERVGGARRGARLAGPNLTRLGVLTSVFSDTRAHTSPPPPTGFSSALLTLSDPGANHTPGGQVWGAGMSPLTPEVGLSQPLTSAHRQCCAALGPDMDSRPLAG